MPTSGRHGPPSVGRWADPAVVDANRAAATEPSSDLAGLRSIPLTGPAASARVPGTLLCSISVPREGSVRVARSWRGRAGSVRSSLQVREATALSRPIRTAGKNDSHSVVSWSLLRASPDTVLQFASILRCLSCRGSTSSFRSSQPEARLSCRQAAWAGTIGGPGTGDASPRKTLSRGVSL